MIPDATVRAAARALGEAAAPARIILFGSYARGDAREDSDLDFLVVEPAVRNHRAEMARLRRAVGEAGAPVDVLVATEEQVREWAQIPGSVLHRAVAEGRTLYERH